MNLLELKANDDVAFAVDLALTVGRFLANRPDELTTESKTTKTDIVTHMDKASEDMIVQAITQSRPADSIIGEEGANLAGTSGRTWVVDPLDGTINYLYDLPAWCVSIGLIDDITNQGLVGVVYAPPLDALYVGVRDVGAFRIRGETASALKVSSIKDFSHALIGTGFGYSSVRRASQARVLKEILPTFRDIRRIGSCAIDLCFVAEGKLDGFFERGVHPWDHAAGALIAREAGAQVSGLRGSPENSDMMVVGAGAVHAELLRLLELHNADSDDVS
ncbi:MAG: inositol monophosphatase [Actinobacteria bacterium]|uniref:inositol-phosphate phosphatase n=1 Tax=freshwater metagenome TaxID=449393 RepID=A0A6J5Z4N4_9ZZZZ|nr:inositol monophosphatase [Actinomycetota bacterium]